VSGGTHAMMHESSELHEQASRGNKLVSLAAAIIAVLAALGTLFSHHRSITALTAKNEAILTQARASDLYNRYESQRVRYHVYTAFIAAGLPPTDHGKETLKSLAEKEQASSLSSFAEAQQKERLAQDYEEHSEAVLKSYETLEIGTTFCEIAIVLVSISALASTRIFLTIGSGLAACGLAFLIYGFFQAH